jgi:hypothetical protein
VRPEIGLEIVQQENEGGSWDTVSLLTLISKGEGESTRFAHVIFSNFRTQTFLGDRHKRWQLWVGGGRTHSPSHLKLVYVAYISKTPRLSPVTDFLYVGCLAQEG